MAATASFNHSQPSMSAPESSDACSRGKWAYNVAAAESRTNIQHEDYAMRRIKEAEKAEKIMHLICWGPTK